MAFFTSLYSGSDGNCSVVRCGDEYLMIDMGKSCKITMEGMKALELPPEQLLGLLVTHEHSDHIKGLKVFLKKHPVPVYGRADTLAALQEKELVPPSAELHPFTESTISLGGFTVTAFPTSHDVPCCGYRIKAADGAVMTMATDLGYLSDVVNQNLEGADLVALEANYDLHSLRYGVYPDYLKRRIESDRGHLDNTVCARKIRELMQAGCKNFALCHLSQKNNSPSIALTALYNELTQAGYIPDPDVKVQTQNRQEPSKWMEF